MVWAASWPLTRTASREEAIQRAGSESSEERGGLTRLEGAQRFVREHGWRKEVGDERMRACGLQQLLVLDMSADEGDEGVRGARVWPWSGPG